MKYKVDANMIQLGSTNPKKKYPAPGFFFGGGQSHQDGETKIPHLHTDIFMCVCVCVCDS